MKGNGKSSHKKEAELDLHYDHNKKSNQLTGEKSVDWSLVKIWCCGKFFSSDGIAAHAELYHAVARRRSSMFLPHTGGSFRPGVLQDESAEAPLVTRAEYWCRKRKGNGKVTSKALDETENSKLLSFKKRKSKEFTSLLMRKSEKARNRVKEERHGRKRTLRNGSVSKKFRVKIEVEENEPKKERHYFCDKCDYVGNFQHALQRHVEAAHEDICYKCTQCNFTTRYKYNLNSHMKAKHLLIKFSCDRCEYTCTERRLIKNHKNAVHDRDKVYSCSQCSFTSGYTAHVKAKHQRVFFPCNLCDYTGTCKRNLNLHVKTHHQGPRLLCPLCNASFGFKYNLNVHLKKRCSRRKQS